MLYHKYNTDSDRFYWGKNPSNLVSPKDKYAQSGMYVRHIACGDLSQAELNSYLYTTPIEACIEITTKCHYSCNTCIANASPNGNHISTRKLKSAIEQLPNSIERITITGGEPLLHPNFDEILTRLSKHYDTIILSTSGEDAKKLESILTNNTLNSLEISLHGSKCVHNSHMGNDLAYDSAMASIKLASAYKTRVEILTTATKETTHSIKDLVHLLNDIDISEHRINSIKNKGRLIGGIHNTINFHLKTSLLSPENKTTVKYRSQPYIFINSEGDVFHVNGY